MPLGSAIRYGLDASKSVLDRVLRCAECKKPPMSHGMPPHRGKDDPHVIPLEWVPVGLREYALAIDLIATLGFIWRLRAAPPLSAWLVTINFLTGGAVLCGASLILLRSAAL